MYLIAVQPKHMFVMQTLFQVLFAMYLIAMQLKHIFGMRCQLS